jgi:hypothetical protein
MQPRMLEWLDLLSRAMFWGAAAVLVLSLAGAAGIVGSDSALPGFEDVQREGRTIAALAAFGGGIAAAGVLSGLGGILALMVADRLERDGTAAAVPTGARPPAEAPPHASE